MGTGPEGHVRPRVGDPAADVEIVRRLARENFDPQGRDWTMVSRALIEYGYAVFMGWLIAGEAYRQAAKQGRGGVRGLARIPRNLRLPRDDAHDLASILVATSIHRFRRTLQEGGWEPSGGAGLATFFVGRCLMELPDAYERWHRQQTRWDQELADVSSVDDGRFSTDPCEVAVAAAYLDQVLPPRKFELERRMLLLANAGYTNAEIARILGAVGIPCSEASVRTRLMRARAHAKEWRNRGEEDNCRAS
jgi:DNA-directed RNA polymerase specialized sigma24 family protein